MADATLQEQLDPAGTGRGVRILRALSTGTKTDYCCDGGAVYPGRVRWTQVTAADSDNDKETAIRAVMNS